jgi:hypothetical protein
VAGHLRTGLQVYGSLGSRHAPQNGLEAVIAPGPRRPVEYVAEPHDAVSNSW